MLWFLAVLILGALPAAMFIWLLALTGRIGELRKRVDDLEEQRARDRRTTARLTVAPSAPAPSAPAPARPAPSPAPAARAWNTEEVIGGVWLQNVGSVLLLVAVFFLILWGYTTGRLGPGALVAAGVALGALLAWRGDRVARTLPAFGHALVGIGLGAAYLSLYLGHFTLRVLPTPVAFTLLTVTSLLAILAGQHYRVQSIAALGVLGAFVPQVAATLAQLPGFEHRPDGLLAYLAFVNLAVFWLAARSTWSGLALTSVLFSAATWSMALTGHEWGWPIEAGLCALFVALGLAPLRRWADRDETATRADLALVAVAPYALVAASWPYFAGATRETSATFFLTLTAVYAAAAWWIDGRRERQDLWRVLLTASVVFATSALERLLGETWTPMGWCVEGAVLVALGVRPRAGWLRVLGYGVMILGGLAVLTPMLAGSAATVSTRLGEVLPLSALTANSIRCLVAIAAFAVIARVLERERDALSPQERSGAPEVLHAVGQMLILLWLARHAWNVAGALHRPDAGPALTAFAWCGQASVLMMAGVASSRAFRRFEGHALGALSAIVLGAALVGTAFATPPFKDPPFFGLVAAFELGWIVLAWWNAHLLANARVALEESERWAPHWITIGGHVALLAWSGLETANYAAGLGVERGAIVGPALASGAWLAQAVATFATGWLRGSSFLRRVGLALFGLTVLKVTLFDLSHADTFVRAVIAVAVGTVLLVVSYVYQRARKNRSTAESAGPTLREP